MGVIETMKTEAAQAEFLRDGQPFRQIGHSAVERGIEAGNLRHGKTLRAQIQPHQISRQVQWSKVNDAFQSRAFSGIHQTRLINNLAAMHETMPDDVGGVAVQVLHQLIESGGMIAQMFIAKISP